MSLRWIAAGWFSRSVCSFFFSSPFLSAVPTNGTRCFKVAPGCPPFPLLFPHLLAISPKLESVPRVRSSVHPRRVESIKSKIARTNSTCPKAAVRGFVRKRRSNPAAPRTSEQSHVRSLLSLFLSLSLSRSHYYIPDNPSTSALSSGIFPVLPR